MIQRDYKSISLYEYHYERKVPEHPTEVKLTDSGRQVTGGGGITPDIVVAAPEAQQVLSNCCYRADVFYPAETGVGGFTRYLPRHQVQPSPRNSKSMTSVMHNFREYLTKHNVHYTEPEMADNLDWIKRKIKQEVFMSTFGQQEGFKVLLEADPQVQKSVEAMPQARALYQNVRKIVAQRTGSARRLPAVTVQLLN